MTAIAQTSTRTLRFTRRRIIGLVLLIGALLMMLAANANIAADVTTVLTLQTGSRDPNITIPTLAYVNVIGLLFIAVGILALWDDERYERLTSSALLLVGILLIPTVLIIPAAGNETNITTILRESLVLSVPIAIGSMAGLWCERSGVTNIAIEGMMLTGACVGFTVLFSLRGVLPPDQIGTMHLLALSAAVFSGALAAVLHAWLSITFATDQIVSGTVINIMAVGLTSFIRRQVLGSNEMGLPQLPEISIPILNDIPILGEVFSNGRPIFYGMFLLVIGSHIVLFYTRWGLRVRAVGEHPSAADTLGIQVNRVRWTSVIIGGMIAGLGGAWFSIEATGSFYDGMTNGTGFIALAAMIFGKWTPFGAFLGALMFGFSSALGTRYQVIGVPIPPQFLQMVPYIVTLLVLAGLVGRAFPPKAVGKPYKK